MKKIIILMIVSLFLVSSSTALITYKLNSNEWGNPQGYQGQQVFYDMSQHGGNDTAICIPFVAGETGIIKTIYFLHNSSPSTTSSYCIDTTLKHPRYDNCTAGETGQSGYLGYPLANDEISVTQGTKYYFCYEQHSDLGGEVDIETVLVDNTYGGDLAFNFDTILPYSNSSRAIETNGEPYMFIDYYTGSFWNGWVSSDYYPSGFAYCYDYIGDNCYVQSPKFNGFTSWTASVSYGCCQYTTNTYPVGVKFTFPFADNTVDKINFWLAKGTLTAPDKDFVFLIYNGSNPTIPIYTSPAISTSILESKGDYYYTNFTYYIHNVVGSITLEQGETYFVAVGMGQASGLGVEYNTVCLSFNDYPSEIYPNNYIPNYQGRYIAGSYPFSYFNMNYEPNFVLTFDNNLEYILPENESLYQCNDDVDNDLDGFTDYPSDPSCDSIYDNDESPVDYSSQSEDICYSQLGCVIIDTFPYSDNPLLHDWYGGNESDVHNTYWYGGYSMKLDTVDEFGNYEEVIIYKDNQNINNYNSLSGNFSISILERPDFYLLVNQPIYLGFVDDDKNYVTAVKMNVTSIGGIYDESINLYAYDSNHWEYVSTLYTSDSDDGLINFEFYIDEEAGTYSIRFMDATGWYDDLEEYSVGSASDGHIASAFLHNTINDNESAEVLVHYVYLTGQDVQSLPTYCSSWSPPYHLIEYFNGYMSICNWNIDPDIFMYGTMAVNNEIDAFSMYKKLDADEEDAIYYENSRYATVKFDLTIHSDSYSNNVVSVYLYNLILSNPYIRLFFKGDGTVTTNEGYSSIEVYDSLVNDVAKEVMIVIDLNDDEFDFYYDGSMVKEDVGFYNPLFNAEYLNGILFQSSYSHYEIDNLVIYESDDAGIEFEAPPTELEEPPDATKPFCKLFRTEQPECYLDSQCDTDYCLVNGKCSRFDYNYCDDNGHTRGNLCLVSGVTYCIISSIGQLILDKFFYFLILLVLLMILVYLWMMFKN